MERLEWLGVLAKQVHSELIFQTPQHLTGSCQEGYLGRICRKSSGQTVSTENG